MANALYDPGRNGFLIGTIAVAAASTIKALLADLSQMGPSVGAWQISAVSNTVNPTVTTVAAHGITVGQKVAISGVNGATGVNGNWVVATVPTTTTFTLTMAAPGVYTTGGFLMNLSLVNVSDLGAGGTVSTTPAFAGMTTPGTNGTFNANSATFSAVTNAGRNVQGIALYQSPALAGGADVATSAQKLIAWIDTLTGFPLIPTGADILINWAVAAPYIFQL